MARKEKFKPGLSFARIWNLRGLVVNLVQFTVIQLVSTEFTESPEPRWEPCPKAGPDFLSLMNDDYLFHLSRQTNALIFLVLIIRLTLINLFKSPGFYLLTKQ